MSAPVDGAARERIRAHHGTTLLVEAGPGTGKTHELVNRIVALVAAGHPLDRLAAITFTEAAAAELRDRIRTGLERVVRADDPGLAGALARRRCAEALDLLDDAALSTIHGFAQRILAAHPLEAGLPPRFDVVDDVAATVAFEERWRAFVDTLLDDPAAEPYLLAALTVGLSLDTLRAVARALHEHLDELPTPGTTSPPLPAVDVSTVLDPLEAAFVRRRGECRRDDDHLARHLDGLHAFGDRLRRAADDLDRLDVLVDAPKLRCAKGRAANWGDVAAVRELCAAAQTACDRAIERVGLAALDALLARVLAFVRDHAAERRRGGRLEFHDLLVLARDLLRARPDVREAEARRYDALLIDELQDTEPIQVELAVLLATDDPHAGTRPWHEVAVAPGRLFLVGDPKQSIYRFRRADLGLYARVEAGLDADHAPLVESYRSVPAVLEWVNAVFARLLGDGVDGVQARHVELHTHRRPSAGTDAPTVAVLGDGIDERVGAVRVREGEEIARLLQRIRDDHWRIVDPQTHAERDATLGDVGLLLPTRTALPEIEAALDRAGIPMRIESQSLVFSTPEVRDLLSVLTAIDDPTDDLALVASLRSPVFGCSDRELVTYAAAGGRWDYRRNPPDALAREHQVVRALHALRELHEARWWRGVAQTVAAVVRERRLLTLALAHRRPRDYWRRVRFFADRARAYEDSGGTGLRGFVEWVQQQADERARAVEVITPEPDDDAVRILTVHGAKGLEFPIVVLAGLNATAIRRREPVLWGAEGPELSVIARGRRFETTGYEGARATEAAHAEAERIRLLYVAATRARDHLVVSLHHKVETDCDAARLVECLDDAPCERLSLAPTAGRDREPRTDPGTPADASDALARREAWLATRRALLVRAARPSTVAATTLASEAAGAAGDPGLAKDVDEAGEAPPWQRGRAGTALGRAVHAVLQSVDLDSGAGLEAAARAQALAEAIPDREREIAARARSALAAPVVRDAVHAGRYWREVPVAAWVDDITLEGFVDLLLERSDGRLVVVDYKTDTVPTDADLDAAMSRYTTQGAAYALALREALGREVARCVFVFARERGPAVEREIADLREAVEHVREQLALRVPAGVGADGLEPPTTAL